VGSVLLLIVLQAADEAALHKAIAERPLEAISLARRAADQLPAETARRLFAAAARVQEERLALLDEDQAAELANVFARALDDPAAAARVRLNWLRSRERSLGPADASGRLRLARLTKRWLEDPAEAARLAQEAWRLNPDLPGADRFLGQELHFRQMEAGWVAEDEAAPTDRKAGLARVRVGLTAKEVRQLLGRPARTARQILDRRYREQWIYDAPASLRIDFDCLRGQEPRVIALHQPGSAQP
jgi:hypothetical protein